MTRPKPKAKAAVFDQAALKRCIRKWQRRLGLSDWTIVGRVRRARDLSGPQKFDKAAEVHWVYASRSAILSVLDPVDYEPELMSPQDHEADVVHELLHLVTVHWVPENGSLEDVMKERALEDTAKALVALDRA